MSFKLDPKTTALVLIDLQNGVLQMDVQPHSSETITSRSRSMAEAFRAHEALVVYVRVRFDDFLSPASDEPTMVPENPPDSLSQITPQAGMQESDLLITKRHWGAFARTTLEQELWSRGIQTIVLAGVATNFGVETTLRQGTGLGFEFVVVEDACGSRTAQMHDFAFQTIFPRLARVRSTAQVLEAFA